MKYLLLLISISGVLFVDACLAQEARSKNAAGIAIYSVDDTGNQTQVSNVIQPTISSQAVNQAQPASQTQASSWQDNAQEVLINALSLTGIKYRYGGNSPATGFDCSGFVRYVFQNAANLTLPPTARAISQIGKRVKKDELQPGDLVFFNTLKSAFSHVGIYIGNNNFIHAPSAGKTVRVESMQQGYWASRFEGAQRLNEEIEKSNNAASCISVAQ